MLSTSDLVNLLRRKVAGEPLRHSFIHEADVCSLPPEELVLGREHAPGTDRGDGIAWYFCSHASYHQSADGGPTPRRKRNVSGGRGRERWHPEAGKKVIPCPDGVEAYTRTLSYLLQIKNPAGISPRFRKQRLGWCMLEVGLQQQQDGVADQQLVLCKVYRSPRADQETPTEASVPGGQLPPPALSCEWECNTPVHDSHCPRVARKLAPHICPASKIMPTEIPPRLAIVRKGSVAAGLTDVIDLCGSSILSAQRMKEMGNLVRSFGNPVVVVSTMGNTATDILLATWKALSCSVREASDIHELAITKELHLRTTDELGLDRSIVSGPLDELEHHLECVATTKELTTTTRDYLVSFGERTSAKLFSEYLNKHDRGTLEEWELRAVPTFGMGGSGLPTATIGRDLGSIKIQLWKDQDSIFTCDHNVCAKAIPLPFLTFDEATEIGFFAAQSIQLAIECGISVRVKNSFNPQAHGTLITKTRTTSKSTLTSIVLKSNITILDIQSTGTLDQTAFIEKAISKFKYFEYLGISVDWVATSEKMSFTLVPSKLLSQELIQPALQKAIEELQKIADVCQVQGRSVISLIGNSQMSTFILGKALNVLGSSRLAVEKVSQRLSYSKVANVSLVVHDSAAERCVQLLHSAFFELNGFPVQVQENRPVTAASSSDKRKADDGHPEAPWGVRQEKMNTERWVLEELERSLLSDNDGDPVELFDGVFRDNNETPPTRADGGDNNYLMPVGADDIFFGGSASMEFFLEQPPTNVPDSWQRRLSLLDSIRSSDPARELAQPRRRAQPVLLRQANFSQSMPSAGHISMPSAAPFDIHLRLLTTLALLWLAVCFTRIFCQADFH